MNLISRCILKMKKYPENYFDAVKFSGTSRVYIVEKDGKYGLLDGDTRKLIMQLQDRQITSYSEGLVAVNQNGKAGYFDLNGKVVVALKYDKVYEFQANRLALVKKDDMYGYISRETLEPVIPVKYDYATIFVNGYAQIYNRGKCGYIDSNGNTIGGLDFDQIGEISEGLFPAQKGTKWGYVDLNGNLAIPFKYNQAKPFSRGYAVVKQNGKSGVINKAGEKVVACRYDSVEYIIDDIACVKSNDKIGYVDTHDKTIVPCELMIYLGENNADEYQSSLNYIKSVYSKKAAEIKSQAAKERLLREYNQEMRKMADARIAYLSYLEKQQMKQYRTTQLRQDCIEEISTSKQGELQEYKNADETEASQIETTEIETTETETAQEQEVDTVVEQEVNQETSEQTKQENNQEVETVKEETIPPFNPDEEIGEYNGGEDAADSVSEDENTNNI